MNTISMNTISMNDILMNDISMNDIFDTSDVFSISMMSYLDLLIHNRIKEIFLLTQENIDQDIISTITAQIKNVSNEIICTKTMN